MGKLFVWKKKVMIVIFFGLVGFFIAGSSLLAQEQNLIKNPFFEEGKGEKDGLAKDWNASYSAGKYETFLDTEEKVEGKFSQRLHSITGHFPRIYQAVPVKPKTAYYFSAYFKSDSSAAQCWLSRDKIWGKRFSSKHAGNGEWKRVFLKWNSGDSKLVYIIFILTETTKNTNLWVDKVELIEESPEITEAYKKYISNINSTIDFSISSVKTEPNVVKSGEDFVVTAKFSTGVEEDAAAYSLDAYVLDVPEKCKDIQDWKFKKSPYGAKYNSYSICPYKWFKRMSGENLSISFTLNTKSWPKGDYRIRLLMLVWKGEKDFYREKRFFLSIL